MAPTLLVLAVAAAWWMARKLDRQREEIADLRAQLDDDADDDDPDDD